LAEAAICHQFASPAWYIQEIEAAGLQMKGVQDLTREVIPTRDICRRRRRLVSPFKMLFPQAARKFTRVIDLISPRAMPDRLAAGIEDV
jgi:hypothetical protein